VPNYPAPPVPADNNVYEVPVPLPQPVPVPNQPVPLPQAVPNQHGGDISMRDLLRRELKNLFAARAPEISRFSKRKAELDRERHADLQLRASLSIVDGSTSSTGVKRLLN
jgi:hypothetical protein